MRFPVEMCRAALGLVQLRDRAKEKFARAEQMFFDREGYEMATRAEVAQYRAWRFREHTDILDLCCGIGGDLLFLGQNAQVTAVDAERRRLEMARLNCSVHELSTIRFIAADVRTLRPRGDAIFFDPARRSDGRRRRRSADYEPPLAFADELRRHIADVAVKVSPAIPEEEIPSGCEVEFVSSRGQCREAVLYFGRLATAARRATILPARDTIASDGGGPAPVGPPGAYVYDPDPAVVRSHLIDELARKLDGWKLDEQIAYLSSDTLIQTPFARAYRVLETMPFQVKKLRRRLREQGFFPQQVKRRRFPLEPIEVERKLGIDSGDIPVALLLTRLADKTTCLICQIIGNSAGSISA
ncbi:MAG: SAM-dependent methyltransferase [Candidatus Latescibacterota bacterium]|jgi:SAM-dependent methyltransferase